MRQDTARTRAAVASLPSAIRAQVHAPVTGLDVALRMDIARARDAQRAMLGDVHSIGQCGAVYAKCDNAAERWLLAVGGVSMGRVAGARDLTQWRVQCGARGAGYLFRDVPAFLAGFDFAGTWREFAFFFGTAFDAGGAAPAPLVVKGGGGASLALLSSG